LVIKLFVICVVCRPINYTIAHEVVTKFYFEGEWHEFTPTIFQNVCNECGMLNSQNDALRAQLDESKRNCARVEGELKYFQDRYFDTRWQLRQLLRTPPPSPPHKHIKTESTDDTSNMPSSYEPTYAYTTKVQEDDEAAGPSTH
jgi:hypothetical protein